MERDAYSRIFWGIVLVLFAIAVPVVKAYGSADITGALFGDAMLVVGCLSLVLLGVLVVVAGRRRLKKIRTMTDLIVQAVNSKNRVVTTDIADAVGLHEVDIRERTDEMIKKREIPVGTRITYVGGEKVVK